MDFAVLMPTRELHIAEAWSYRLSAMFLWWRQASLPLVKCHLPIDYSNSFLQVS